MLVLEHLMTKHLKVKYLQCSFLKLSETNQFYVLGLAEGIKHMQGKEGDKCLVKMLDNSTGVEPVFYNRLLKR